MYICMHGSLLDHASHGYCTRIACVHFMIHIHMHGLCIHQLYSIMVLYYSSQDQKTALHYASKGGHRDTVRVLLERGADPNIRDRVSGVWIMYELQMYLHGCL